MTSSTDQGSRNDPGFRRDINGLRAWAVVTVLLYHFRIPGFQSGFIGVDVFLVISGFLMTQIVLNRLQSRRFTFREFYLARAIRIIPALAFLCLILLALGWFTLSTLEYRELAIQAASSLGFWSNIHFHNAFGYFDLLSQEKLLLHTWSLSLEWQFYVIYPIAVVLLAKLLPTVRFRRSIVCLAVISLLSCILVTNASPASGFFLLPTRGWEFLAGGLVYMYARNVELHVRTRWLIESTGLALLIGAAAFLSDVKWPGAWAVLPTAGAVMVLIAARQSSVLLTIRPFQWIGTRSYSIYLWHWPIAVVLFYLQLERDAIAVAIGLATSLLLGHVSYELVERGRLFSVSPRFRPSTTAMISVWIAALGISAFVFIANGVPGRMPPAVDEAAAEAHNRHTTPTTCDAITSSPGTVCEYGIGELQAILVGDSHALSIASAFAQARPDVDSKVATWIQPGCLNVLSARMVPGVFRSGTRCTEFNAWMMESLRGVDSTIPVVIVNRTTAYIAGFPEDRSSLPPVPAIEFGTVYSGMNDQFRKEFIDEYVATACALAQQRTVFMIQPIPEMGVDVPRYVARQIAMGIDHFPHVSLADYRKRHEIVLEAQQRSMSTCGVRILETTALLCPAGICMSEIDGRPLYYDDDHLSERGNALLIPMFQAIFEAPAVKPFSASD